MLNKEMSEVLTTTGQMRAKTQRRTQPQDPSHLRMMKTQRSNPNTRLPPATRNVGSDIEEESCPRVVGGG